MTFYGSETDGDPNVGPSEDDAGNPTGFRGSWDVYVSQSLDALSAIAGASNRWLQRISGGASVAIAAW